jgi:hypothetical protein
MLPAWTSPATPGLYGVVAPAKPAYAAVRMDVCAFVGVAPRGPSRVPRPPGARPDESPPQRRSVAVAVESVDDYRRLYGGFDGPGRLPYAVHAFFAGGGRRAYVVRVVADDGGDPRLAIAHGHVKADLAAPLLLRAADEGSWGDGLRAALGFAVTPLARTTPTAPKTLALRPAAPLVAGALLRLTTVAGAQTLVFVTAVRRGQDGDLELSLDVAVAAVEVEVEVVTGVLEVVDRAGNHERHAGLGLAAEHPRWLATVLREESTLVRHADAAAAVRPADDLRLPCEPRLPPVDPEEAQFSGGADRHAQISAADFFDPDWQPGDPEPGAGIAALAHLADLATVVVPDLYVPEPLPPQDLTPAPARQRSPRFVPCDPPAPPPPADVRPSPQLEKLHLDPNLDLDKIVELQTAALAHVEKLGDVVLLLDVPPRLTPARILRWRTHFRSAYVAAYHPWLLVAPEDDGRDGRVSLCPSAVAAGVIARQERDHGVPHGPAGVIAVGVVDVLEQVGPDVHARLHAAGVNVYQRERAGVRLTAARTLADDPAYRQLSVRRLISLLRRTVLLQTQWAVFEPNTPQLRRDLASALRAWLRQLHRAGALRGLAETDAFFVRCDDALNTRADGDAGRLLVEIGVAPAEPLEFIVLRLVRNGDGELRVEGRAP